MNNEQQPSVSIVICTQNRAEALKRHALNSLVYSTYTPLEILIVDDASTDATKGIVDSFRTSLPQLIYVHNAVSRGLSHARNLGVQRATGELIAFIDDDCAVEPDWLSRLVTVYTSDPSVSVVGGCSFIGETYERFNPEGVVYGCNMSLRSSVFQTHRFDTNLYFNQCSHYDEIDLIDRLQAHGYKVRYTDKARVRHYIAPAAYRSRARLGSVLNRIYLFAKKSTLSNYFYCVMRYLLSLRTRTGQSAQDRSILRELRELQEFSIDPRENVGVLQRLHFILLLFMVIPIKAYTAPRTMRYETKTFS